MTQWYVKNLSTLTKISVQTLHHYDRIGLLKPSVRLANGYRVYSEKDLLRLQQIIALKFFDFELSQIKKLLDADIDVIEHFSAQLRFLEGKAKSLLEASHTLKNILSDCNQNKSIPWETIIKLIEVYRMTQELENSWAGRVLDAEQIKEYAQFEQGLKTRFTSGEKKNFEKNWANLVKEISTNLEKAPSSEFGMAIGKRSMDMVNGLYGKEHVSLRNTIWEKGYRDGKMDEEHALAPEVVEWLDQAISAYYRKRALDILDQVKAEENPLVLKQWNTLLDDMFGNDQTQRKAFYEIAMNDVDVSAVAKRWIKKIAKD